MTDAAKFQNALRIMYSLDEVDAVLTPQKAEGFHRDPMRTAIRMDEEAWAKVYAMIEARQ
jgi:hypothetical protein